MAAYGVGAWTLGQPGSPGRTLVPAEPPIRGVCGVRRDRPVTGAAGAGSLVYRRTGWRRHRSNLVSAGPVATAAASGVPGFSDLADVWHSGAPLGWDVTDPYPVADAVCLLFSDLSRAITGEIVHVDGGYHALGAPVGAA